MLSDDAFLAALDDCTLSKGCFKHVDHLRAAYLFLQRHELFDAIQRFSTSLKRFTAHHGAQGLYHATITGALLVIMNERMQRTPSENFESFLLDNPDLVVNARGVLERHYPKEVLDSDFARRTFVLPPPVRAG